MQPFPPACKDCSHALKDGGFLSIWINKCVFHPLLSSNALCFGKWILLQVTECSFVGSRMLIHWQRITSVYLELGYLICHVLFKHCQYTHCCPKYKASPCPRVITEGTLKNQSASLCCSGTMPKDVMHIAWWVFCYCLVCFFAPSVLLRFINSYNISKPTAKETASKSVIECHIASHTYTRYNILGQWCKITQTPLPSSTPLLNTAAYKNHLFLFHIKASTSVCQQDSKLIPERSSSLHRNFSCRPLLRLVYTFLWAVIAAHPAPGSAGAQGSDL